MASDDQESVQSGEIHELTSSFEDENEDDQVDPRVQVELEKLNASTEIINKFREELEEAKIAGRQAFHHMTQKLHELTIKLGKCIQKARPYYEARVEVKKAQAQLQLAAKEYEKANVSLKAAKEMVRITEDGLRRQGGKLDESWQEMMNFATKKIQQCELDIRLRKQEHLHASKLVAEGEIKVRLLEKAYKSAINKSKPYYELSAQLNHFVEKEKSKVQQLEKRIAQAKASYAEGLANLESISDQIHLQRRLKDELLLRQRDSGCGTISESVSLAESLDLSSLNDTILDDAQTSSDVSVKAAADKHQQFLNALHDMIYSKSDEEGETFSKPEMRRTASDGSSGVEPSLCESLSATSLSEENAKCDSDASVAVIKRALYASSSVDSAVSFAGSECELDALDDELIDDLKFDSQPTFVV